MEDKNVSGISTELDQVEKEFRREVAITTVRPLIHKILFILWIVFDVALVGLLILVTVSYLLVGQWSDRTSTAELVNNVESIHSSALSESASSLFVDETIVLGSEGKYDFYTEIQNSNTDWYASFNYSFVSSEGETDTSHGFIFPGEVRAFIILNQSFETKPSRVEMSVDDISWQRITAHSIDDINEWYADHSDFITTDLSHGIIEIGADKIARSSFTVKNNTPYSYWSAPFILTLTRNGIIVGVNQISIAGFEAGETREIDINWFNNALTSGDLIIQPAIDYWDDEVYMGAESDIEIDIRDIEVD